MFKITPAHDPNDFAVGQRHNLKQIRIMDDAGVINELGGKYAGLDRYEARKAMVKDLEEQDLLVKVQPHVHNVGTHDRCGTVIEPIISQQWYVKMEELAKPAIEVVRNKETKFVPERFEKHISTGWKTFKIGVFQDNYGGDTEFQFGM